MTDTTREQQLSALSAENEFLKAENERLRQQNELLRKAVFGPKSEKKAISDTAMNGGEQICLFNEAEIESRHEEDDPVTVPAHKRKKKRSRAEIIGELPVEEVVHKVEDKTCDLCGSEMKPVGKEFVHDELVYVPAKLFVRKHYVEVVKCVNCGTDESRDAEQPDDIEKEHFRKAAAPSLLIPRSFCSPELLAHIIYEKYCNAMPLYRQEQDLRAHGVELSRTTMANWIIRIAEEKAKPVFDAMKAELLAGSVIHADETTVQVLHEEGRKAKTKSRMWVYCNAKADGKYMALYDYRPTRAGANAADFLGSFSGCIVCDGDDGYNKLGSGISRAGCWAHARRKFIEAEPTDPELKKSSAAAEGVKWCDRLFALERRCDGKDADGNQISPPISYEERHRYRQEESKPLVDAFFAWLETVSPAGGSALAKAVQYALNEKKYLYTFLSDPRIEISNNRAENAIRPFVVGRKNWLFSDSAKGAASSAMLYSLTVTARQNGLNVEEYLTELLRTEQPIMPY